MKTTADKHGDVYAGGKGCIWRWRICGTATDDMWDDNDGKMGCKDGDVLGKYQQGITANLRAYRCSGIIVIVHNISGEDSFGRAWWRRCGKTRMDTTVEEMRYGNRRDVGRLIWQNRLKEQQRTG